MSLAGSSVLILLLTVAVLLYKWSTKNLNYWQKRKFPHLKSLPLVGNFGSTLLGKINIAEMYRDMYHQFGNVKCFGILIGTNPALITKDPDLIMRIMVKDFRYFSDRGFHVSEHDLLGNNLFFMRNPKWRLLRSKTVPIFSTVKMNSYHDIADKSTDDLIKYLDEINSIEEVMPTRQVMGNAMTDIMSKVVCGIEISSIRNPNQRHVEIQNSVFAPSFKAQARNLINFFSPFFAKYVNMFSSELDSYFDTLTWQTIDMRKAGNIKRNDFLQILAELLDEEMKLPESDRVLTKQDVVSNVFIMILAGYETSTSTSSLTLHELAYNKPVQDKLRKECQDVYRKCGGKMSLKDLKQLEYLDQVISEVIRIYPLEITLFRQCTEDYNIPGTQLVIEKGVFVHIPTLALHTDPNLWKDPETFDPDRFSEENAHSIIPGSYLPFGDGPRICIGKRFAIMQLKLLVSKILLNYEVSPCEKSKRHYPLIINSMLSVPEGDCWLTFTKLNQG